MNLGEAITFGRKELHKTAATCSCGTQWGLRNARKIKTTKIADLKKQLEA